jgi:hypothetical protein
MLVSCLAHSLTVGMEVVCPFRMSADFCWTTLVLRRFYAREFVKLILFCTERILVRYDKVTWTYKIVAKESRGYYELKRKP